jgi:glycerol uptake facilitator-like aquaporin
MQAILGGILLLLLCFHSLVLMHVRVTSAFMDITYSTVHDMYMHADPIVNGFVVAFTFGMAITVMVYMTAHTSGGHLNPAITAGCMAAGLTTPIQAAANIIAQCIGTVFSALFVVLLVPEKLRDASSLAVNSVPDDSTVMRAFLGAIRLSLMLSCFW